MTYFKWLLIFFHCFISLYFNIIEKISSQIIRKNYQNLTIKILLSKKIIIDWSQEHITLSFLSYHYITLPDINYILFLSLYLFLFIPETLPSIGLGTADVYISPIVGKKTTLPWDLVFINYTQWLPSSYV